MGFNAEARKIPSGAARRRCRRRLCRCNARASPTAAGNHGGGDLARGQHFRGTKFDLGSRAKDSARRESACRLALRPTPTTSTLDEFIMKDPATVTEARNISKERRSVQLKRVVRQKGEATNDEEQKTGPRSKVRLAPSARTSLGHEPSPQRSRTHSWQRQPAASPARCGKVLTRQGVGGRPCGLRRSPRRCRSGHFREWQRLSSASAPDRGGRKRNGADSQHHQ